MSDKYKYNPLTGKLDNAGITDHGDLAGLSDNDHTQYVLGNTTITGATKTKITYDTKGLVTAGADATAADVGALSSTGPITVTNATVSGTPASASQVNTGDPNTEGFIVKGNTYTPASKNPDQVTGLVAWYKADAIEGLSDGNPISSWVDSGPNGYTLTQSDNNLRPSYKVNILNGKPVVRFDGQNDYLNSSSWVSQSQPFTVIAVAKSGGSADSEILFGNQAGSRYLFLAATTNKWTTNFGSSLGEATGTGARDTWWILTAIYNSTSSEIFTNGTSRVSGNAGTGALDTLRVSNGQTIDWYGDIAEVIVYSGALSISDRSGVESYLASKYNITIAGQVAQVSNLQEYHNSADGLLSGVDASGRYVMATVAGAPTGTPPNGTTVLDTDNSRLYVYSGGWKYTTLSA